MAASSSPPLVFRVFSARLNPNGEIPKRSRLFVGTSKPSLPFLYSSPLRSAVVAFSRRKKNSSSVSKTDPPSNSKQIKDGQKDDIDEDALEALFSQLEEDLKNDNLSDDDGDDEITEEDLARLEQELEEALGDGDHDEILGGLPLNSDNVGDEYDSDEEERPPKLKNWQLRRLARALKTGRRKTSIKSLAAELGLDRAFVLELLRDPPPYLLLMSASLPDEVAQTPFQPETTETPAQPETTETPALPETTPVESPPVTDDTTESKPKVQEPVHAMQTRWFMQKRLKKVHIETLERVYARTKRPTNTMISSIVHVTKLPGKRVVKWFEDKRLQDGVPDQRAPFRRSMPETISTS